MKIFILCAFLFPIVLTSSCGRPLEAADGSDNECGFRYVAGKQCIVCEKGGVSCKWD